MNYQYAVEEDAENAHREEGQERFAFFPVELRKVRQNKLGEFTLGQLVN